MLNIALLSPSKGAYSETFIQAHKEMLKGRVFYYYGNLEDKTLEGAIPLKKTWKKNLFKLQRKLFHKTYTWYFEQFIKKSFIENKIDVVLAEYGQTAHAHLSVVKELHLPLIVHFHGYDASVIKEIENNNYYKEIFNYASSIVVVSHKMHQDLINLGCPADKLVYNVYGPRDEFFKVKPTFSNPQFIAVGRFVNKKAPYYTILAFVEVVKKFPNARLVMAGNGDLLNACKDLVKFHNLESNVDFIGIITPKEFREYLKESLAFVQHSITADDGDAEGTPVSILEASAAGLPVISTKHAGIPDVIAHEKTGLLVEEHDVMGMAKNMIRLLENPGFAKELGKNGKENIRANFTLKRHIEALDELIARAIVRQ